MSPNEKKLDELLQAAVEERAAIDAIDKALADLQTAMNHAATKFNIVAEVGAEPIPEAGRRVPSVFLNRKIIKVLA